MADFVDKVAKGTVKMQGRRVLGIGIGMVGLSQRSVASLEGKVRTPRPGSGDSHIAIEEGGYYERRQCLGYLPGTPRQPGDTTTKGDTPATITGWVPLSCVDPGTGPEKRAIQSAMCIGLSDSHALDICEDVVSRDLASELPVL